MPNPPIALPNLSAPAVIGTIRRTLMVEEINPVVNAFCYINMASKLPQENYGFAGDVAPFAKIGTGQTKVSTLNDYSILVSNETYLTGLTITDDERDYDQTEQVQQRIASLGNTANIHWNTMLSDLLLAAPSTVAYDKVPFFSNSHLGSQSNILSYSLATAPLPSGTPNTVASPHPSAVSDAILKAIFKVIGAKSDKGQYINQNSKRFSVVVPLQLAQRTFQSTINDTEAIYAPNVLQTLRAAGFSLDIYTMPQLDSAWYNNGSMTQFVLVDNDGSAADKPFILQQHQRGIKVEPSRDSDNLLDKYTINAKRGAGVSLWEKAILVQLVA
jgi:Mu-like prophage major head subunit gpT